MLRAAWLRGQINARHWWKRRPPTAWTGDTERARFFFTGYDAMKEQRLRGRGVTLMPVPPVEDVEARYPTTAAGQLRQSYPDMLAVHA